mmetsp:Transcript_19400/g.73323  ORF Transcript_19400/g.73323 Transcript_19400/m.73323 type:complete len:239 (+) Transcript_19400:977-1693(+)
MYQLLCVIDLFNVSFHPMCSGLYASACSAQRGSSTPGTPTRMAKRLPDSGHLVSSGCSAIPGPMDVMKRMSRSGPARTGQVGRRTGTSIICTTSFRAGSMRSTFSPKQMHTQMHPSASTQAPSKTPSSMPISSRSATTSPSLMQRVSSPYAKRRSFRLGESVKYIVLPSGLKQMLFAQETSSSMSRFTRPSGPMRKTPTAAGQSGPSAPSPLKPPATKRPWRSTFPSLRRRSFCSSCA